MNNIYSLNQDSAGDEIWGFLKSEDHESKSYAKGFAALLQHVANRGLSSLPKKKRDCWIQGGIRFCELKKGPWRMSYFEFGRNIVLTTIFRKNKDKPVEEYKRAINLWEIFKASPRWEG